MKRTIAALILGLTSCSANESVTCVTGFRFDGERCVPVQTPPSFDDALQALDACRPLPGGALDPLTGCIGDACVGDPVDPWVERYGDPDSCYQYSGNPQEVFCLWADVGFEGRWADEDVDLWPDPAAPLLRIHLLPDSTVATPAGLGAGMSLRCWTDAYGAPSYMTIVDGQGGLQVSYAVFDPIGMTTYFNQSNTSDMYFYGAFLVP